MLITIGRGPPKMQPKNLALHISDAARRELRDAFVVVGIVSGIISGFFRARKIQPRGFKWKTFRIEAIVAVVTLAIFGKIIGTASAWLWAHGWIAMNGGGAVWWVIALEFGAYFFLFDTYFYWLHRWMHKEPFYSCVHKLHHK